MKKIILTLFITILCHFAFSQNTNTYPWPSNGKVGIGTITPTGKLSVMVGANEDRQLDFSLIGIGLPAAQRHAYIGISDGGGTAPFDVVGDLYIAPRTSLARAIRFVTFDGTTVAERMMLDNTGNLGIGTSNAYGYKLAVNGKIVATSITVKLYANWPDYVFKPSYHLRSLSEVKNYIDLNHHLPEIASVKEMQKNGLNLGDNQVKLLQKVEELTLYLIDGDKKEKQQQTQIDTLSEQLKSQQKEIDQLKRQLASIMIKTVNSPNGPFNFIRYSCY